MERSLYDDDHAAFRDAVRRFLDVEVVSRREEWDAAGIVARQLFATAGRSGFLGADVPESYGGGGVQDFRSTP